MKPANYMMHDSRRAASGAGKPASSLGTFATAGPRVAYPEPPELWSPSLMRLRAADRRRVGLAGAGRIGTSPAAAPAQSPAPAVSFQKQRYES